MSKVNQDAKKRRQRQDSLQSPATPQRNASAPIKASTLAVPPPPPQTGKVKLHKRVDNAESILRNRTQKAIVAPSIQTHAQEDLEEPTLLPPTLAAEIKAGKQLKSLKEVPDPVKLKPKTLSEEIRQKQAALQEVLPVNRGGSKLATAYAAEPEKALPEALRTEIAEVKAGKQLKQVPPPPYEQAVKLGSTPPLGAAPAAQEQYDFPPPPYEPPAGLAKDLQEKYRLPKPLLEVVDVLTREANNLILMEKIGKDNAKHFQKQISNMNKLAATTATSQVNKIYMVQGQLNDLQSWCDGLKSKSSLVKSFANMVGQEIKYVFTHKPTNADKEKLKQARQEYTNTKALKTALNQIKEDIKAPKKRISSMKKQEAKAQQQGQGRW